MAAPDGKVCLRVDSHWTLVGDWELGVLFSRNGAADRVRYADFGLFDETPLPAPATCPSLGVARICGGNCGICAVDEVCHGRAPLHPYGFCMPRYPQGCSLGKPCPNMSDRCFTFRVQPQAQPLADMYGVCLPRAVCEDLAMNYPGGGTCSGM